MKKVLSLLLSLLLFCGIFAVPASAAETFVLPNKVRTSYGTEITYQIKGTNLSIEVTKASEVLESDGMVSFVELYPLLNTCSQNDRNVLLAMNEWRHFPELVFALSSLVRSGRIKTVNYLGQKYEFTVKSGTVTKITTDSETLPYHFANGKFSKYEYYDEDGYDFQVFNCNYDTNGLKSGFNGDAYFHYDYTCKLKDGNIYEETKDGGTSYGPYQETARFSFEGNLLKMSTRDIYDGYDRDHIRKRFFYNSDGTLSSVDFQWIDKYPADGDPKEITKTDSYAVYIY